MRDSLTREPKSMWREPEEYSHSRYKEQLSPPCSRADMQCPRESPTAAHSFDRLSSRYWGSVDGREVAEMLCHGSVLGIFLWNAGKRIHRKVQYFKSRCQTTRGHGGRICRLQALEKPCALPLILFFHQESTLGRNLIVGNSQFLLC